MRQENNKPDVGVTKTDDSRSRAHYPHNVPTSLTQVDLAAQSHPGHVRDNNEDHFLAVRISRSLETLLTNLIEGVIPRRLDEIAYAMMVADGMGGMAAGEVASSIALLKLLELAVETPDWIMKMTHPENAEVILRRMTRRFRQIDDELMLQGETNPSLYGMGTTLTVALTLGTDLMLTHIGDSRAYLLRGKKLHQLTKDHTLGQALIDAGIAKADDTATQAMKRVLTAALGTTAESTDPQVQRLQLDDGDQLLLCTDGLYEMVSDNTIASVLASTDSSKSGCQELINLALAAGGADNVTVILARYHFPRENAE